MPSADRAETPLPWQNPAFMNEMYKRVWANANADLSRRLQQAAERALRSRLTAEGYGEFVSVSRIRSRVLMLGAIEAICMRLAILPFATASSKLASSRFRPQSWQHSASRSERPRGR